MRIVKIFFMLAFFVGMTPCLADGLFFEDEPIQDGLPVIEMSQNFADVYEKLNGVKWGGKNLNVAIESLENLNKSAHIAATDERVVLVWDDSIVANYPRPGAGDWNGFGEITTALILKMRAHDARLRGLSENEMYQVVVDSLMRGVDENGRYIFSKAAEIAEDGRILTSVGIEGGRDMRGNFRVTGIYKGAPADTAGISEGDLIAQINGRDVRDMTDTELADVITVMPLTGGIETIFAFTAFSTILTEVSSNTAAASIAIPIIQSISEALGLNVVPYILVTIVAVNCAYILPVSTRAIPIGYGLEPSELFKHGVLLSVLNVILTTVVGYIFINYWPAFGQI